MLKTSEIAVKLHKKAILSTAIFCGVLFYLGYFGLKHWIVDAHLPNQEWIDNIVSPYIYLTQEHDGKEAEFLLVSMLVLLPISHFVFSFFKRVTRPAFHSLIILIGVLFSFYVIGYSRFFVWELALSKYGLLTLFFLWLSSKVRHTPVALMGVFILLVILVIPYQQVSYFDYAFVAAPATKLLKDGDFKAFSSQYDLLVSLPALVAEYIGGDASLHILFNRIIVFLFGLLFYFTARIVVGNRYAFLLFVFWFVMKYVASFDSVVIAASSPLRVEAWLLVSFLALRYGVYHIFTAIGFGVLIILHFNFGILYALGFICFCGYSILIEIINQKRIVAIFPILKKVSLPIFILCLSFFIHYLIFGQWFSAAIVQYRSLQIGMMPLTSDGLFWLYPVLFVAVFLSIVTTYFSYNNNSKALFLLIFVTVFSMSYFYGRSHYKVLSVLASSAILFIGWLMAKKEDKSPLISRNSAILLFWMILLFEKTNLESKIETIQAVFKNGQLIKSQNPVLSATEIAVIKKLNFEDRPMSFLIGDGLSYYYAQQLHQPTFTNPSPIDAILELDTLSKQLNHALKMKVVVIAKSEDLQASKVIEKLDYNKSDTLDGFLLLRK